ncbi:protein FRIGIDA-like, partial [Trifolium medium]|nr:protein FRIGIDA-like [Trifolium medium]
MSGCSSKARLKSPLKQDAVTAAVSWRKRLIGEGGVGAATEMDARGLILFLACFGIPHDFRNEEIVNLVLLSKPGEISHALRNSVVLSRRVS